MENYPQAPQDAKIDHTEAVEAPALEALTQKDAQEQSTKNVSIWRKAFNFLGVAGGAAAVGIGGAASVEAIADALKVDKAVTTSTQDGPGVPYDKDAYMPQQAPELVPKFPEFNSEPDSAVDNSNVFTIPSSPTPGVEPKESDTLLKEYGDMPPMPDGWTPVPSELAEERSIELPELDGLIMPSIDDKLNESGEYIGPSSEASR